MEVDNNNRDGQIGLLIQLAELANAIREIKNERIVRYKENKSQQQTGITSSEENINPPKQRLHTDIIKTNKIMGNR